MACIMAKSATLLSVSVCTCALLGLQFEPNPSLVIWMLFVPSQKEGDERAAEV